MIVFPVEKKRERRNEATAGGRKANSDEGSPVSAVHQK